MDTTDRYDFRDLENYLARLPQCSSIECRDSAFTPGQVAECLEGRLPKPVNDEQQWLEE